MTPNESLTVESKFSRIVRFRASSFSSVDGEGTVRVGPLVTSGSTLQSMRFVCATASSKHSVNDDPGNSDAGVPMLHLGLGGRKVDCRGNRRDVLLPHALAARARLTRVGRGWGPTDLPALLKSAQLRAPQAHLTSDPPSTCHIGPDSKRQRSSSAFDRCSTGVGAASTGWAASIARSNQPTNGAGPNRILLPPRR